MRVADCVDEADVVMEADPVGVADPKVTVLDRDAVCVAEMEVDEDLESVLELEIVSDCEADRLPDCDNV